MKIIRNKENKLVPYLFDESAILELNTEGLVTENFKALDITSDAFEVLSSIPAPVDFIPNALIWDAGWSIANQELVDAFNLAKANSLQQVKNRKRQEINEARLQANFSAFIHEGKVIACDQLSRSDIDGVNGYVGINGTLPPDFPGAWKAKDDSYLPIASVDAWKAFYLSMYNAGLGHFMKSQQLKALIDSASTEEEVKAIKW